MNYDETLSNFDFNVNLRRYTTATAAVATATKVARFWLTISSNPGSKRLESSA
jgi:hypothetical protein